MAPTPRRAVPSHGTLDELTPTVDRPQLMPEDEKKLMEVERNSEAIE